MWETQSEFFIFHDINVFYKAKNNAQVDRYECIKQIEWNCA